MATIERHLQARRAAGRWKLALATLISLAAALIVIVSIASGHTGQRTTAIRQAGLGTVRGVGAVRGAVRGLRAVGQSESGACPAHDAAAGSGHPALSTRPGAARSLVPRTPTEVLLCHYTGLTEPAPLSIPAPQFTLEAQRLITSAGEASALAAGLDAIPASTGTRYFCPADFGQYVVAWFEYASGAADPVTLDVNGCNAVTNGIVRRLGVDGNAIGRLMTLVPAPRPAQVRVELRLCGGPAPGACHVSSFTSCGPQPTGCVAADRAAIVDGAGDTVTTLALHGGRAGPLALIPGTYTFRLLAGASGHVLKSSRATLLPGSSSTIALTVDVP